MITVRLSFILLALVGSLVAPMQVSAHLSPTNSLVEIERQLEENPDDVPLLLDKAHLLQQNRRLEASEAVLESTDTLEKPRGADAQYLWIALKWRQGELEEALKLSDQGIREFPDNFFQWQLRGQILMDADREDEAIDAFRQALEFNEADNSRGHVFVSRLLIERNEEGDKEEAVKLLNRAIEGTAGQSELHHMSLQLELELGNYDKALGHLDVLVQRFGNQITFARRRAEILEAAGRIEQSIAAYESALALTDASAGQYTTVREELKAEIDRLRALESEPSDEQSGVKE